ncbi:type II toxin-antitoxin system RelE/ParE family toxin [Candidatus Peregrinibacteria bacterium]|nr:type II toxin-antitoxin system RelE/ParE family toxin [Candidatus Peregrinibacteria bacterium]
MKFYKFQFSSNAERYFDILPRQLQKRILNKLLFFEKSGNPLKFAKQMHGLEKIYRFRIGDYRLMIKPEDKTTIIILFVLKIGHRREIYDNL